ncbi:MAG: SOS response-associated peptidase family protein [Bdellovibrionales bacterium]
MCYAAMVEQNAHKLKEQFQAVIDYRQISDVLQFKKLAGERLKLSPGVVDGFSRDFGPGDREVIELFESNLALQFSLLDEEIGENQNQLERLRYEQLQKTTKTIEKKIGVLERKLQSLENKKLSVAGQTNDKSYIYPHWNFLAVANVNGQNLIQNFEYGHFRDTGNILEDLLYSAGKHPLNKRYGLYNTKLESLDPNYFEEIRRNLNSSEMKREQERSLRWDDFKRGVGIFTGSRKKFLERELNLLGIGEQYIQNEKLSTKSIWEPLFLKQRAVVVAKSFQESVLKSDYFKDPQIEDDKHIPVEFFMQGGDAVYFPAVFSRKTFPQQTKSYISIVTTLPRPEVEDKGHDRSPIALTKEGARKYLSGEIASFKDFKILASQESDLREFYSRPRA